MRLKYYLRGIGVGVVITTFLFMIIISFNQYNDKPQNKAIRDTESKTVADYEDSAQNAADTENTAPSETQIEEPPQQEPAQVFVPEQPETPPEQPEVTPEQPDVMPEQPETPPEQPDAAQETPPEASVEKVRFVIGGGEFSDVVCKKLQEAGLIDDAASFNKFLVEEDYDNYINPGVYDIPKNATYEEIAVLLTTKV